MSLTSLEQVFIKLAHEIDTSQPSAPKSLFTKAEKVWQRVSDTARNPMRALSNHRRGLRDSPSLAESKGKIQSGQSHYVRNDSEAKNQNNGINDVSNTSENLGSSSRNVNPLTTSNLDLTTCTDSNSEDSNLNSTGHKTVPPSLVKPPSTTSRGTVTPVPYDNEQSSVGSSSYRSHDGGRPSQLKFGKDIQDAADDFDEVCHSSAIRLLLSTTCFGLQPVYLNNPILSITYIPKILI